MTGFEKSVNICGLSVWVMSSPFPRDQTGTDTTCCATPWRVIVSDIVEGRSGAMALFSSSYRIRLADGGEF